MRDLTSFELALIQIIITTRLKMAYPDKEPEVSIVKGEEKTPEGQTWYQIHMDDFNIHNSPLLAQVRGAILPLYSKDVPYWQEWCKATEQILGITIIDIDADDTDFVDIEFVVDPQDL